jgi:prepilin peptidase CpaA
VAISAATGRGLAAFVVLAGLFALRMMGGGDVKLLTALALWLRPVLFAKLADHGAGGRRADRGHGHLARDAAAQGPPQDSYGVAIATAGLCVLVQRMARGFRRSRLAKAKLNQFVGWLPGYSVRAG